MSVLHRQKILFVDIIPASLGVLVIRPVDADFFMNALFTFQHWFTIKFYHLFSLSCRFLCTFFVVCIGCRKTRCIMHLCVILDTSPLNSFPQKIHLVVPVIFTHTLNFIIFFHLALINISE